MLYNYKENQEILIKTYNRKNKKLYKDLIDK